MLKNITLSAEEKLIQAARHRAEQQRTTLNQLFRDWLVRYAAQDEASAKYRKLMKELKHVSAGKKFSREELNAR
jgi:hypothetical protein